MIRSISLQNFQSHRDTTLNFHENVNVILGQSDSGKTAILRSLRKLAFNKPSGDEMKSHWGGKLQIEMFTDDAHIVYSKDKEAEYILGDTHFKAFGTTVPDEITKALNLSEINIQSQLDSVFLLSETPGKVAEFFNKIAHLEVIDKATSNINSAIRELTSDIKYSEAQEILLTGNLDKYSHLEKFETEVIALEELNKENIKLCSDHDKLGKLLETYQKNTDAVLSYKNILELEKPVDDILADIKLRNEKDLQAEKLNKLIEQIKEVQSIVESQKALLLVETPVNELLLLYKEKETLVKQHESLNKAVTNLSNTQVNLNTARVNYASLHLQFEKNMGDVCILCGGIIKNVKN